MNAEEPGSGFDAHRREVLRKLADQLIPAGDGMPSASDVGVADGLLDAVLKVRDDLAPELIRILDEVATQEPGEAIACLRADDPDGFQTLSFVVAGGYLMSRDVDALIGYPGQQPDEVDPFSYALADARLAEPVERRGPIYRPTPAALRLSPESERGEST